MVKLEIAMGKKTNKNIILFDFDGVIIDSFAPAFEVSKLICPHLTKDQYSTRFEGNINNWKDVDEEHTDMCRHDVDFFVEYLPRMERAGIVHGMLEVIEELRNHYTLIIVSSTISSPIRSYMEQHNAASSFTEIMGNDIHASKVEKIKMVFTKYSVGASDCVFITDTLGDMKEANHVGVNTIGVSWGFHNKEILSRGNLFRIVESPRDLPIAVADYFSKR